MSPAHRKAPAVIAGGSKIVRTANSAMFLPEGSRLRRRPRFAVWPRPPEFMQRFEARALFYDCFWHADGARVLLVGPPVMNLRVHYDQARFFAQPLDYWLKPIFHTSLSVTVTELREVPAGTTDILVTLGGQTALLPIQPNNSAAFAGRRVLFSMNRDNRLEWIAEWAGWHARLHGTDAIVLFDNGSTRYHPADIAEMLARLPGIVRVAVPSWPYAFGMADQRVLLNPYWAHFLQIASMSVVLRRFGAHAAALLNCDIDELAATRSGQSIYDTLAETRAGLSVFRGVWIEAATASPAPRDHRDYVMRQSDPKLARSGARKWVLDPTRDWLEKLDVHPYWHWIARRPAGAKSMPADAFYRHFRAINNGWKEDRTRPRDAAGLVVDEALVADFERLQAADA